MGCTRLEGQVAQMQHCAHATRRLGNSGAHTAQGGQSRLALLCPLGIFASWSPHAKDGPRAERCAFACGGVCCHSIRPSSCAVL